MYRATSPPPVEWPTSERFDQCSEIVGIAVHIVVRRGLARPAVATPVVGYHAEAVLFEKKHLPVPHIGIQRPAV
jgi:hypothetical protein